MKPPKMTKADDDGTPHCPHCSAPLWAATVTIEDLMTHWPVGGWITVGADGYAGEDEHLTIECGECRKPVAVGFNADADSWFEWQVKFVAMRTKKDLALLGVEQL